MSRTPPVVEWLFPFGKKELQGLISGYYWMLCVLADVLSLPVRSSVLIIFMIFRIFLSANVINGMSNRLWKRLAWKVMNTCPRCCVLQYLKNCVQYLAIFHMFLLFKSLWYVVFFHFHFIHGWFLSHKIHSNCTVVLGQVVTRAHS